MIMISTRRTLVVLAAAAVASLLAACGQPRSSFSSEALAAEQTKAAATVTATAKSPEEKLLRVRNWPNYLPDGILEEFEKETGIKVEYRTFATNESLHSLLADNKSDDDIVVPGSAYASIQIQRGWLQPLDLSLLPNAKNLDPQIMKVLASADAGNAHLIPWAWGTTTVGINRTKVEQALGDTPIPENSWELVFNPRFTEKLKGCGIAMLDSPSEVVPAAAHYAGRSAYTNNPADHAAAAEIAEAVRSDIKRFGGNLIDNLASGKLCAALGRSGDFNQAAEKSRKTGSKDVIQALLPSTGALSFFDTMAIPVGAKHPKNAHTFINFMLRPEVAARMVNEMGYSTGNIAAKALANERIAANPTIFMGKEDIAKLVAPGTFTNQGRVSMITQYLSFAYGIRDTTKLVQ